MRNDKKRLIRIGTAEKRDIGLWKEGVSIESVFGTPIDSLIQRLSTARYRLASDHLRDAKKQMKQTPPLYRSAISRFYYSMYHAMRSAAFIYHGGDDHEKHSELPLNIPKDFPNPTQWAGSLKRARLLRNRVDYDPYPRTNSSWKASAILLQNEAATLLRECRAYLKSKGCNTK